MDYLKMQKAFDTFTSNKEQETAVIQNLASEIETVQKAVEMIQLLISSGKAKVQGGEIDILN
jgi:hypothetical protein